MSGFKLLTVGNPKTLKDETQGYLTFILHLAPAKLSGYQTCPKATEGCRKACLNKAGRGGMFRAGENTNVIQQARIRKTKLFFEDRGSVRHQENPTDARPIHGTSRVQWRRV